MSEPRGPAQSFGAVLRDTREVAAYPAGEWPVLVREHLSSLPVEVLLTLG